MSINILILILIISSVNLFMKHFKTDFQSLTQPGRSECGVQLAWGFPPRSKWTYGEVFHPAVVPQPPFIKCFGVLLNTSLHKTIRCWRTLGVSSLRRGEKFSAFDNWNYSFINWLPRINRIKIFQWVCHHCTNKRSLRNEN